MDYSYVVLYQSQTGNTRNIAETMYKAIESENKRLVDIDNTSNIPDADVYLVGFNIHNEICSIDILDFLEQISGGYIALFSSCGFIPTEEYKAAIEKKICAWISEEVQYMGMYLCQGKVLEKQKTVMRQNMPDKAEILNRMFEIGDSHPDPQDYKNAVAFVKEIQTRIR